MILGDPALTAADGAHGLGAVSISELFHYAARRRPEALALADPANRSDFTDGKPRRLSYADADRTVAAIAARLRGMGLPTDAVIGIQMPNTVENILATLGVLRAGMIAAPLPLLWRRADTVTALARIGAKALIVCSRVGATEHCQLALQAAAEVFSIRYVCAFGANLPDGAVSFDDLSRSSPSMSARADWSRLPARIPSCSRVGLPPSWKAGFRRRRTFFRRCCRHPLPA
jgi:acyl-CoA synthetase (AMP-forming)/AMP-acid ligase II